MAAKVAAKKLAGRPVVHHLAGILPIFRVLSKSAPAVAAKTLEVGVGEKVWTHERKVMRWRIHGMNQGPRLMTSSKKHWKRRMGHSSLQISILAQKDFLLSSCSVTECMEQNVLSRLWKWCSNKHGPRIVRLCANGQLTFSLCFRSSTRICLMKLRRRDCCSVMQNVDVVGGAEVMLLDRMTLHAPGSTCQMTVKKMVTSRYWI